LNTIITETTEHGEMPLDVYQKLADDRILFICDEITDHIATDIVATLLLKDAEDPQRKITLFINSGGGDIRNALMICDMIKMVDAPVETVCIGEAMDEAIIILSSGTPGMRHATKNSVFAASQLVQSWMSQSDLSDATRYLELTTGDNKRMMEVIAQTTGKTLKQAMSDFDRRVFMNAKQAQKHGFIDKIIKPIKPISNVSKASKVRKAATK
jgi:ATP-dependent Clp protease protease subunit